MSRAAQVAALGLAVGGSVSCKRQRAPAAPSLQPISRSALDPHVHQLIEAMRSSQLQAVYARMTPELRSRVRLGDLEAASARIRRAFGEPQGIIEEHTQREGELLWYSALVEYRHRTATGELEVAPMLYQFATNARGEFARLLIREHWFLQSVEGPADAYVPITRIHFPSNGQWFVMHGGRTKATNYHHGHRAQRFAYDLVVKRNGRLRRPNTAKTNNAAHYCHGKDILAPAAGTVVRSINDAPENVPGTRGRAGGNGVVIDHGFGEYSNIWHAIPGSVRVKVGDHVEAGQLIAKVGNSGRSTLPHIHFHVSYRTGKGGVHEQFGLPAGFVDIYVDERWRPAAMPIRGEFVQPADATPSARQLTAGPRIFLAV